MIESGSKLRHLAFFEELGKIDDTDPHWAAVSAGLVVLRLVDHWIETGPSAARPPRWSVNAVREAIAKVPETTPLRRILSGIFDIIVDSSTVDVHMLSPRLMAYGQALEYEAKWALAADVYQTVLAYADPVNDADLVVPGFIQLAFARRTQGDLDGAAAAYEQASRVAYAAGDLIGVLRGRLGDAKIATARGNMPQAQQILDDTISRAAASGLADVKSRALTDRAYVAALCGQYDRSIRYSYDALEISATQRDRDRILTNIATGFRDLGLFDVARDAYLVLVATAQEQYIRWMAEVNLMELAAQQGIELQFDKYRRDLEAADFTPQLRITYLLHVGRGHHALGQSEKGIPYIERAIALASEYKLNQMMFEAEEALADVKRRTTHVRPQATPISDVGVQTVIEAIQEMKEMAGIS